MLHDVRPPDYSPVLVLMNSRGEDMLDSATRGHYYDDSVILYWRDISKKIPAAIRKPLEPDSNFPNYWPRGYHYFGVSPLEGDTLIIQLTRSDYDTMYFWPSRDDIKKIFYNKQLLAPPKEMSQYPLHDSFPLTIVK